jgi:predicted nucleotidyltransferase
MSKITKTIDELLAQLKSMLPKLRTSYQIQSLEVFGSFVRGDQKEGSDLDLLVSFNTVPTLFQFVELENYLSDELGIKVDLVMKDSLKPAIGKRILEEAEPV